MQVNRYLTCRQLKQKVSTQAGLRGLRRLAWVDTFCRCMNTPLYQTWFITNCLSDEKLTLSQTSPVCSTSLLKTMWEKEKLLVTSNFSFSHGVFYSFGELSAILSKLKLSSANSFRLEESKICRLGKG